MSRKWGPIRALQTRLIIYPADTFIWRRDRVPTLYHDEPHERSNRYQFMWRPEVWTCPYCTESCFRHPLFDLRGTRKVEIRHTNFHFSSKKVTSKSRKVTESCFRHPLFDLRGTRKVEIRHTNFHFSSKKVTSKSWSFWPDNCQKTFHFST